MADAVGPGMLWCPSGQGFCSIVLRGQSSPAPQKIAPFPKNLTAKRLEQMTNAMQEGLYWSFNVIKKEKICLGANPFRRYNISTKPLHEIRVLMGDVIPGERMVRST